MKIVNLGLDCTSWDWRWGVTGRNAPPKTKISYPEKPSMLGRRILTWYARFFGTGEHSVVWSPTCNLKWYMPATGLSLHLWFVSIQPKRQTVQKTLWSFAGRPWMKQDFEHALDFQVTSKNSTLEHMVSFTASTLAWIQPLAHQSPDPSWTPLLYRSSWEPCWSIPS